MAYQVIVVEEDKQVLEKLTTALRRSPDFEVASTYKTADLALGQSRMFKPNLFLINVDDAETVKLLRSFVNSYPHAKILGMLSSWNSSIVYSCTKVGIDGCILKSFTVEEIKKALQLYALRGEKRPSRLIAFFSPKGRAGRTTAASILALKLAEKSGDRVALIDADLQFGDMPIFFDVDPENTIIEASQDIKLLNPLTFEQYFYPLQDNLSLLASSEQPEYAELVEAENFIEVIKMTCTLFRYILIDLPSGFNPISVSTCDLVDTSVIMVMLDNVFDIYHMRRALEMFQTFRKDRKRIYTCFTRVNPCTEEERLKLQRELGYPVTDILPNEYQMISLANSGRLLKGLPEESLLIKYAEQFADDIMNDRR